MCICVYLHVFMDAYGLCVSVGIYVYVHAYMCILLAHVYKQLREFGSPYIKIDIVVQLLSHVLLVATLWTVAHQDPLSSTLS